MSKLRHSVLIPVIGAISISMLSGCLESPKPFSETHPGAADAGMDHSAHNQNNQNQNQTQTQNTTIDYVPSQWGAKQELATDNVTDSGVMLHSLKFTPTAQGSGYANWEIMGPTGKSGFAYYDASASAPTLTASSPLPTDHTASHISFAYDTSAGDTLAAWSNNNTIHTNLFMPGMGASWMTAQARGAGKNPHAFINSTGDQFVLAEVALTDGFALGMYSKLSSSSNWSTTAAQLDRIGKTLKQYTVAVDKDGAPVVAWLEQTPNAATTDEQFSVNVARYSTTGGWTQTGTDIFPSGSIVTDGNIVSMALAIDNANNTYMIVSTSNNGRHIYSAKQSSTAWNTTQLNNPNKTNTHVENTPVVAGFKNNKMLIAWLEHDLNTTTNSAKPALYSGASLKIYAREGTGGTTRIIERSISADTLAAERVVASSTTGMTIGALSANLVNSGEAILSWAEKGASTTNIMSSNYTINTSGAGTWSQKELIFSTNSTSIQVEATSTMIDANKKGVTFWSEKPPATTTGTSIKISRSTRTNSLNIQSSNNNDTTNNNNDNNQNDNNNQNSTLSPNWLSGNTADITFQSFDGEQIEGPKMLIDNLGNRIVYFSRSPQSYDFNQAMEVTNYFVRYSNGVWTRLLQNSTILDGLVQPIRFSQLHMAKNTGTLVGLVSDQTRYFVIFYSPVSGWNKSVVEGISAGNTPPRLHVDDEGMVTLIYTKFTQNVTTLNAVHYMTATSFSNVFELSIPNGSYELGHNHNVTPGGIVHIGWIDTVLHQTQGVIRELHTATFTPQSGWTETTQVLSSNQLDNYLHTHYIVTPTGKQVFLQNDVLNHRLRYSIRSTDGSWGAITTLIENFVPVSDQYDNLLSSKSLHVATGRDDNVLVVWKEPMENTSAVPMFMYKSVMLNGTDNTWSSPSSISGELHESQKQLNVTLVDNTTAVATWVTGDWKKIYANTFSLTSGWAVTPSLIANEAGASNLLKPTIVSNLTDTIIAWKKQTQTTTGYDNSIWSSVNQ
ncbi:MAG: hypothetical protein OEZ43_19795 [Gammaproteobacteria bacterium]|nr:hypothetical protein [Gammaproteobacteria bacterium]